MNNYDNKLLHLVLNQIEKDLEEQEYDALDELLVQLIKSEGSRELLLGYLPDESLDELNTEFPNG